VVLSVAGAPSGQTLTGGAVGHRQLGIGGFGGIKFAGDSSGGGR